MTVDVKVHAVHLMNVEAVLNDCSLLDPSSSVQFSSVIFLEWPK